MFQYMRSAISVSPRVLICKWPFRKLGVYMRQCQSGAHCSSCPKVRHSACSDNDTRSRCSHFCSSVSISSAFPQEQGWECVCPVFSASHQDRCEDGSWQEQPTAMPMSLRSPPFPADCILLDCSWSIPIPSVCRSLRPFGKVSADLRCIVHLESRQWVALLVWQKFNKLIGTQTITRTAGCLWNSWSIHVRGSWSMDSMR